MNELFIYDTVEIIMEKAVLLRDADTKKDVKI